jgi:uncharacterized protein (DUF697 family)
MNKEPLITVVAAEPVMPSARDQLAHLGSHRGLIVRRALLIGAIRGFFPVPMVDEQIARRVQAGLLGKLASGRQVDLPPAAAAELAAADGTAANLTVTAAVLLLARLAGRKFLALLAAGRGADEMARTYYRATLFDHYCAKLHVGGPLTADGAGRLRTAIEAELSTLTLGPALTAFREGGRVLGRTLLEAPRWLSQRIAQLAERFVRTGGNPDVLDAVVEPSGDDDSWLERAARTVEEMLSGAGNDHLARLIASFEARWQSQASS